jgi:pyridoxal phosphate enzyme (YggS family)
MIANNILSIKSELPSHVRLVAVSKTKSESDIMEAYNSGQRLFGENKVQELTPKYENLPKDIEWHMIGHLQTNKVKYVAPFVSLFHGVDSLKLLETINKEAIKNNRTINCLLQIHIAKEETKFGFDENELFAMFQNPAYSALHNICICGLMGMATFSDNEALVRSEFKYLSQLFNKLKSSIFTENVNFKEISMGMSDDYKIAIQEGSTLVRIGSHIFGDRIYNTKL